MDHPDRPARLPKVLLNAVTDSNLIDSKFGSGGAKDDVRRVRRIIRRRMS